VKKEFISDVYGFSNKEEILDNFFWPVSHDEYLKIYNHVQHSMWKMIEDESDRFNVAILRIISTPITLFIVHILHADMVCSRVKEKNMDFKSVVGSSNVHNIDNLGYNLYEQVWQDNGVVFDNRKYSLSNKGLVRNCAKWLISQYRKTNGVSDTVVTLNPLLEQYILKNNISCFKPYPTYWWSGYKRGSSNSKHELFKRLSNVLSPLCQTYSKNQHVYNYINNVLDHWVSDSVSRLDYLLSGKLVDGISNLYTGTQGSYMAKLISQAVLMNGGEVHSFAHGQGKFWFDDPRIRNTELLTLGTYHDHTQQAAERLRSLSSSWREQDHENLKIISNYSNKMDCKIVEHRSKVRKVMLVGSGYMGDRRQPTSIESCTQLNLELRLARKLIDSGYELLIKVHPKGIGYPKGLYRDVLPEAKVTAGWFEEVYSQADAFVFYNFASTAFCEAISLTSKPIVLVHPGVQSILEVEMNILKNRCEVIPTSFDENNKIVFDYDLISNYLSKGVWAVSDEIKVKYINYMSDRASPEL